MSDESAERALFECLKLHALPLSTVHRVAIEVELERQQGNKAQTALALGIGRTTLHRFLMGKHRRSMKV